MDFSFSQDQTAIRDLARQVFTDRNSDQFMAGFDRAGRTYDEEQWQLLADQGLLGIAVPEAFGGSGLGFTELCLLLEEQGRRVAPLPLFSSVVLGALPIGQFGDDRQKAKYLTPLAAGTLKLTAAIAELGMASAVAGQVTARRDGEQWVLDGCLDCVADGSVADAILVPAFIDGEMAFFIVDTDQQGVVVEAQTTSLRANTSSLRLTNATLSSEAILGEPGQGSAIMEWLELHAQTAICAIVLGVTEEALKRTAEFTCERKQFGAPIGSFQAVAMQAADAYIDIEALRCAYWLALYKLSNQLEARAEVHSAKWHAADAGHRVAYRTQHLYGGIGADLEYPSHRYFLWAKHFGMLLGGRSSAISRLGALLAADDTIGLAALEI